eukprot:COSAG06_NODE_7841_length_2358_cov_1.149624_2_plen_131_part_00
MTRLDKPPATRPVLDCADKRADALIQQRIPPQEARVVQRQSVVEAQVARDSCLSVCELDDWNPCVRHSNDLINLTERAAECIKGQLQQLLCVQVSICRLEAEVHVTRLVGKSALAGTKQMNLVVWQCTWP